MTIAAIDYGKKRLGIAAADPAGIVVYPVTTIERTSLNRDLDKIKECLSQLEVSKIIVGYPLNMDGSAGPAAHAAETFAAHLREALRLPVELYDERLSTFEAEERLKPIGRRRKALVDAVAATVILESWLRRQNPIKAAAKPD
jgi:putative holliday junction resolvase